ncbi:hypothetical protein KEM60_01092 [Austwickia sp. TVS 96-490-7B]|nr:hypothetical protein [Austwickia sp. TVS 96-490-7B]
MRVRLTGAGGAESGLICHRSVAFPPDVTMASSTSEDAIVVVGITG